MQLGKSQESPLINNVKKLTRSERNSFTEKKHKKSGKLYVEDNEGNFAQNLKKYFHGHCKTLLHNQRIREAMNVN